MARFTMLALASFATTSALLLYVDVAARVV